MWLKQTHWLLGNSSLLNWMAWNYCMNEWMKWNDSLLYYFTANWSNQRANFSYWQITVQMDNNHKKEEGKVERMEHIEMG